MKARQSMQNDISGIKQELDVITRVIADTVPVEAIYLFGSYAYGALNKDSDLDLYVVFRDDLSIFPIIANFYVLSRRTGRKILWQICSYLRE